jgi:F-type H+-transporting ATPase subunit b
MLGTAEIRIIPDWTILIELAIFIIVIIVLNAFVIRPMLRVMDRRREFTVDASEEAEKLSNDAEQLEQGRHEVLAMALREAQSDRDERTQHTLREADRIKADALSRMDETTSSSEVSVEAAEGSIIEEMNQRSRELADEIVARIEG